MLYHVEEYGNMSNKTSTCLYIDKGILETVHRMDLNISKVSENALILEAVFSFRPFSLLVASIVPLETWRTGAGFQHQFTGKNTLSTLFLK
jgi:hypothetical protein